MGSGSKLIAALGVLLALGGCTQESASPQGPQGPMLTAGTTGMQNPAATAGTTAMDPPPAANTAGMTGFMSVFDVPVEQGMAMAVKDINAAGGVLGRQLELITTNNESDPTKIQSAAQEAIEMGMPRMSANICGQIGLRAPPPERMALSKRMPAARSTSM